MLEYWKKHYNKYADFIIIEGPEAGGHLGFKQEEIRTLVKENYISFQNEVKDMISYIREFELLHNIHIPIILGGGISTKNDVKRIMNLDVDGIQVGSRFVTTYECDADIKYKVI